jgi:hypothetical protein
MRLSRRTTKSGGMWSVRRTNRLIRVCQVMDLLLIFCALPPFLCAALPPDAAHRHSSRL